MIRQFPGTKVCRIAQQKLKPGGSKSPSPARRAYLQPSPRRCVSIVMRTLAHIYVRIAQLHETLKAVSNPARVGASLDPK